MWVVVHMLTHYEYPPALLPGAAASVRSGEHLGTPSLNLVAGLPIIWSSTADRSISVLIRSAIACF